MQRKSKHGKSRSPGKDGYRECFQVFSVWKSGRSQSGHLPSKHPIRITTTSLYSTDSSQEHLPAGIPTGRAV